MNYAIDRAIAQQLHDDLLREHERLAGADRPLFPRILLSHKHREHLRTIRHAIQRLLMFINCDDIPPMLDWRPDYVGPSWVIVEAQKALDQVKEIPA